MKTSVCIAVALSGLVLASGGASAKPKSQVELQVRLRVQQAQMQAKVQHERSKAAASPTRANKFQLVSNQIELAELDQEIRQCAYGIVHQQHPH